jgi:hypothetical protein
VNEEDTIDGLSFDPQPDARESIMTRVKGMINNDDK